MLSGCGPTAVYMIEALRKIVEIDPIFRVVWSSRPRGPRGPRRGLLDRARRLSVAKVRDRLAGYANDWQLRGFDRSVCERLFGSSELPPIGDVIDVEARSINSDETAAKIRAAAPDILLVNGAPIIKPSIFEIPRLGTVNVHFGIAPRYRGTNANFWPLYLRDYDHVGVTVHYINKAVDAGKLLALGYPEYGPDDDEASIMAKCAVLATELFASYLEKTGGEAPGRAQESLGVLYRSRDRTPWKVLELALRRKLPGQNFPHRPERRVEFFEDRR